MNESAKFQSILPYKNHLSRLIVLDSHQRVLHSGVNATVVHTRQKFWIIRVKTLTRSIVGNCITCFRFNGRNLSQLLGDLPQERVNPAPPFGNGGMDFAGPMPYRCGKTETKCYLVVFVCFVTKAIHLDVTKALDTQECMKAIRRFISRRGCAAHIFSDNGTNFTGSLNDLIKLKRMLKEKYGTDCLPQAVLDLGVNWSTIPAKASHFGGLWEAGVKSMKLLLFKTIGTTANLYLDGGNAYTGNDNLVIVAKIKTGNGNISNRRILKLRKIPINTS